MLNMERADELNRGRSGRLRVPMPQVRQRDALGVLTRPRLTKAPRLVFAASSSKP